MQKHIVVNDGLTQNSIAASTVNQIRRMMAWADNCKRLQHLMRATLFTQTEVSQGPVTTSDLPVHWKRGGRTPPSTETQTYADTASTSISQSGNGSILPSECFAGMDTDSRVALDSSGIKAIFYDSCLVREALRTFFRMNSTPRMSWSQCRVSWAAPLLEPPLLRR